jgi:hypothetical protein
MFVHTELRNAKLQPGRPPDFSLRPRARSLPRLQNPVCIQTLTLSPQPRAIPSSFLFNRFQTLFSSRRTTVLNNPFGIKSFRPHSRYNGCIPSALYFPPLPFLPSPLFLTLRMRSLRSFTKECLRTPLQPTRCALFFKTAGCMGICNQFLELKLLEDSRLLGLVPPTPLVPTLSASFLRIWSRASRGDSTCSEPLFSLHGSRVTKHGSRTLSAGNDGFP